MSFHRDTMLVIWEAYEFPLEYFALLERLGSFKAAEWEDLKNRLASAHPEVGRRVLENLIAECTEYNEIQEHTDGEIPISSGEQG